MINQKKPVSLFSATILVIANMIGTGVFTTLGFQLASVHSPFSQSCCGWWEELSAFAERLPMVNWAR